MKLYLIRHGRQNSRLCNVNVDLCEEGYRQAALLGERLFPKKIQAVYSSDLLRAVETAQAANLYWNVEHTICPELREIDFGEMEGLLEALESREISLEDSFEKYKEGMALLKAAGEKIDTVEKAMLVLNDQGEADEF